VQNSRTINTSGSISGGGNLGSDRTLSLVNDSSSPGANRYYGTNSSGTKGWFTFPSGSGGNVTGSGGDAGYVTAWNGGTGLITTEIRQGLNGISIGGDDPSYVGKLYVNGSAKFSQGVAIGTTLSVDGSAWFNNYASFSGAVNMAGLSTTVDIRDLLVQGRRTLSVTLPASPSAVTVSADEYNVFRLNYSSTDAGITLSGGKDGCVVWLISENNSRSFRIKNTVRGDSNHEGVGGAVIQLIKAGSYWYIVSKHDNNW